MNRLEHKVAVVTGGARGIGWAVAQRLLAEGASVVVGDVLPKPEGSLDPADEARFAYRTHDVTSRSSWDQIVRSTEEAFGPISILVNNAAILDHSRVEVLEEAVFRRVLDVNLIGPYLGMQTVIDPMRRAGGGSIINIVAATAMIGMSRHAAYGAAKWGLRGFVKTAALELGADAIRVNSVCPGPIMSDRVAKRRAEGAISDVVLAKLPLRRWGTPEEVGALCAYLASDEAGFVTGADYSIDGGLSAGISMDDGIEATSLRVEAGIGAGEAMR